VRLRPSMAACVPSGEPGGWCAREATDCVARCALEVEYVAEASADEVSSSEDTTSFAFQASVTVVNNLHEDGEDAHLRAWQCTWAFATGEAVQRDAAFATDVAVLVSPGGPGGQPARLVNALGDAGAVPPLGRKAFAFRGVASGHSTPPRTIETVGLNGASCVALDAPSNDVETIANVSACPSHVSARIFRFCCGDALGAQADPPPPESTSNAFQSSTVWTSVFITATALLCIALVARLARALARLYPSVRFSQKQRDSETTRKTTAYLPGQTVAETAVDVEGIVLWDGARSSTLDNTNRAYPSPSPSAASLTETDHRETDDSDADPDPDPATDAGVPSVAFEELDFGETLGRGAYGVVRRGVWTRRVPSKESGDITNDDAVSCSASSSDTVPETASEKVILTATPVAVKTLHSTRAGALPTKRALRGFKREVAVLSRLRHPCVVRLLGACLTPPHVCIVEELIEGGSLHAYLRGSRPGARRQRLEKHAPAPLPFAETLDICGDVASAMAYLASNGVVHRDLKTQNVLLVFHPRTGRPHAKVADFGISKSVSGADGFERVENATGGWTVGCLTGCGAAGTPAWMAPELFRDSPVADESSDAYSFGVIVWECLTGKTPWGWLSAPIQIVFAVAVEGKRLPFPEAKETREIDEGDAAATGTAATRDSRSRVLRALLEKCWAEDPTQRPKFEEMREVFRRLRGRAARGSAARHEPCF